MNLETRRWLALAGRSTAKEIGTATQEVHSPHTAESVAIKISATTEHVAIETAGTEIAPYRTAKDIDGITIAAEPTCVSAELSAAKLISPGDSRNARLRARAGAG